MAFFESRAICRNLREIELQIERRRAVSPHTSAEGNKLVMQAQLVRLITRWHVLASTNVTIDCSPFDEE